MKPRTIAATAAMLVLLASAAEALNLRASTARVSRACDIGRQSIYHIAYVGLDSTAPGAVLGDQAGAASVQAYHLRFSSVLTETTAACDAAGSTAIWNVVQPAIDIGGSQGSIYRSMIENDLNRPYVVRYDARGRILRIAHDPSAGELGTSVMRRIAAEMEIVAPANASAFAQTWHADEPDVVGSRASTYTFEPWVDDPFGTPTLAFHRTSGIAIDPPNDGRMIRHATIHGVADDRGHLNFDGSIGELETTYTEQDTITGHIVSRSQVSLKAEQIAEPHVNADRLAAIGSYATSLLASNDASQLHPIVSDAAADRRGFVNLLGHDTAAMLAHDLAALPKKTDARGRATIADKFAAIFYLQPATIARFTPDARHADPESNAFRIIVQALGHADTPRAQQALLDLFEARAHEAKAGASLAASVGLLEQPIRNVDAALERQSRGSQAQTAQAAELARGTIAWTIASSDRERSRRIVTALVGDVLAARSPDTVETGLLALGNTHDPAVLDRLRPYVRDRDADIRAAAAVALRHQQSSDADQLLVALLSDPDASVRLSAAQAFDSRNPSDAAYRALAYALEHDASAVTRDDALEAIWKARDAHPDAVALVTEAAHADPDRSVRDAAQAALSSQGADEPELQAPMDAVLGSR